MTHIDDKVMVHVLRLFL